jgi:N-acetyl-gamma-glutamyl-phosphate reductase
VSSCLTVDENIDSLRSLYKKFYAGHPFTIVSDETVDLKQVVNTNKCLVGLEKEGDKLVVHTAIDNLLKGASGQAVQNMNLMFGLDESAGLRLKSIVF